MFVSRVATAGFGVLGTVLAMNVSKIGSLLEIANKLINAFSGPLFGIYILAMFSRRATAGGARRGRRRIADELLRRVSRRDRVHVAVDAWDGRRRWPSGWCGRLSCRTAV